MFQKTFSVMAHVRALAVLEKALGPCIAGVGDVLVNDVVEHLTAATLREVLREDLTRKGKELLRHNRDTIIAEKIFDDVSRDVQCRHQSLEYLSSAT